MTLIKSISGFRGTIGGVVQKNLTPIDIVQSTAAFAQHINQKSTPPATIVVGRDGRKSGPHVFTLVAETVRAMGCHLIDLGLSTTPSVEMAVIHHKADAGIVLTASHNPKEWNALKLLDHRGEFLDQTSGEEIIALSNSPELSFAPMDQWGTYKRDDKAIERHVESILEDELIQADRIKEKNYHVILDAINSTGAIAIPALLDALHCSYEIINEEVNGEFAHNPEPLSDHLTDLKAIVADKKADLGIAVDPDVDRLALVDENGKYIGEEYTLVVATDFLLSSKNGGHFVSNLSSSKALQDFIISKGGTYESSAVGEVNVVKKMKETKAILGGEGNGGVIYPALHYGRDALVGIAFALQHMANENKPLSQIRENYPRYEMIKDKIAIPQGKNIQALLDQLQQSFPGHDCITIDGLKIMFNQGWVHLRASNTEPILRLYAEHQTQEKARSLANRVRREFEQIIEYH
ncbi:MAG: phosphoglucosamine mutase [Bacteroidetes bacterium]|nr:phosphoglucosamine mutase [Bacteroidota bacterium]